VTRRRGDVVMIDDAIHYTIISIIHLLQLQAPEIQQSRGIQYIQMGSCYHAHEKQ